jgi:hypothetical protein
MPYRAPPIGHKRVGRVRRGVLRAFIAAGNRDLTTSELLVWSHALELYRGVPMRVRRYYCQSVRRSAALLCDRIGRGKGSARPLLWRLKSPPK